MLRISAATTACSIASLPPQRECFPLLMVAEEVMLVGVVPVLVLGMGLLHYKNTAAQQIHRSRLASEWKAGVLGSVPPSPRANNGVLLPAIAARALPAGTNTRVVRKAASLRQGLRP
jgi:hypothetical protein